MLPKAITKIRNYIRLELDSDTQDSNKTALMFKLERKFGKSIQEILSDTSITGVQLAERLGIDETTISKWRKRFGIDVENSGKFVSADQEGRH